MMLPCRVMLLISHQQSAVQRWEGRMTYLLTITYCDNIKILLNMFI